MVTGLPPSKEIPSNHRKRYTEHGEWAFPVFPTSISIVGSPPTPYIFDDRCDASDAAEQLMNVYNLDKEDRKNRGLKGREWALSDEAGFTSEKMAYRIMDHIDKLLNEWSPRERYNVITVGDFELPTVPHNLVY